MNVHGLFRLLSAIVLLAGLSACATVDQKINLLYSPPDKQFGIHSGEVIVSLSNALSQQPSPQGGWIIGSLNNVHGVHQANLLSDRLVKEWISDALLVELKRAGYSAASSALLPPGTRRGLVLTGVHAVLDVNAGAVTAKTAHELTFNVEIFIDGTKQKTLTISSRDNQTVAMSASQKEKEQIMLHSLQDAMQKLIPEIIVLFNNP